MEIFKMWKYTKMNVLVVICAAIYAATLIPFKALVLIPGVTEIRPAAALPMVFGMLFGPAGAWGVAIGNFIADLSGGTFGINCIFSFFGNFVLSYIPYKFYYLLKGSEYYKIKISNKKEVWRFCWILLVSTIACGMIIAYGQVVFKILPFYVLFTIIVINDTIVPIIIGIPLFNLLSPRLTRWGMVWMDIMPMQSKVNKFKVCLISVLIILGAAWGVISEFFSITYIMRVIIGGLMVLLLLFACIKSQ